MCKTGGKREQCQEPCRKFSEKCGASTSRVYSYVFAYTMQCVQLCLCYFTPLSCTYACACTISSDRSDLMEAHPETRVCPPMVGCSLLIRKPTQGGQSHCKCELLTCTMVWSPLAQAAQSSHNGRY